MSAADELGYDSEEEEMPATERDLADDAQWKLIQKNTFTRWANEHLKTVSKNINDLELDFADGLRLISLVEVLSGKKFRHINKRPNFRTQKLENVTMTLRFLEEDEGIKLVNIDSTHIVDAHLKLILGLIWTLILHYSISMPMWDDDDFEDPDFGSKTPKQKLLIWIQNKVPEKPINNFTTDWNDGKAIGALVDAIAPGLCPDWESWDPKNARQNAKEAMNAAEQWLDVPQLIKPEELTNKNVDEMSMMTYLSQFPNAKLKPGAPLRPKTNPTKVRAYGPGIEPKGNSVGAQARFTVETFSAGKGKVEVSVINPQGIQEPCEIIFNNDRNLTYTCIYMPTIEGEYRVIVKFAIKEIPKSPFKVNVEGIAGDPSKVIASGPGIERTGNMVSKKTYFHVLTKAAGVGMVDCVILDPHGEKTSVKPKLTAETAEKYLVEYTPKEEGLHQIHVFFAGKPIAKSPFGVGVAPPCNPSKCYATGRGIQPKGIRVRDVADFKVHTEGAGNAEVKVIVLGPGGSHEKVKVKKVDVCTYECEYIPLKPGKYVVTVQFGGQDIPKSPFKVDVAPAKQSKIRAYGPGLEGGIVGCSADFVVETNGETGALNFSIEGPSQAKIDVHDIGDGSADVKYWPTISGEYAVHVLCNEEDIPGSPFMAQIQPTSATCNPALVKAYGPGLRQSGVAPNVWAEFTVDTREAGTGKLNISCLDVNCNPLDVQVLDNRDGTYSCRYLPKKTVKHTILISFADTNIPESPFRVNVSEVSKPQEVKVYGPGIEKGVKMHEPTYFVVDCKKAGPGDVAIALTDDKGIDVPVETVDNKDGTFTIQYQPYTTGTYTASVFFAEKKVPQSPIKIEVAPSCDVSKVFIDGLEPTYELGVETDFDVITTNAGKKPKDVVVNITNPKGKVTKAKLDELDDGYMASFKMAEVGVHTIEVEIGGKPVPGTPRRIECKPKGQAPPPTPKSAAQKVKAYGDGLKKGVTNKPCEFTIDTREAGPGALGLTVEGPCEAKIDCKDNGDGTCGVKYHPVEPGEYTVNIMYADEHIPRSPFKALVVPPGRENLDVSGIRVTGPGVEPEGVFLESLTDFTVDARSVTRTGDGKVKAILTNPQGVKYDTIVNNNKDGTYKVNYTPFEQGEHQIDVTFEGMPVPNSPFKVNVVPGFDASRVKAYGPGLEGGSTNTPQVFTVETRGAGQGGLGLSIEGPSEAKMTCRDNRDGSCTVEYLPEKPGEYDIGVKFAETHVPGSPFHVGIQNKLDPTKVKVSGPGVDPNGVRNLQPTSFTIDTIEAGSAFLEVNTIDKKGKKKPAEVTPVGDGTYDCTYTPETEGPCKVEVKYADKQIPGSPFGTNILPAHDVTKVKVDGTGIKPEVMASFPVTFMIDTREAGIADLEVQILDPTGQPVRPQILDNGDGTYTVAYTPEDVGTYQITVKFGGQPVPKAPFKVASKRCGDAKKCFITEGLEEYVVVGQESVLTINTSEAGQGQINCHIRNPVGQEADIDIEDNGDGTVSIFYTPLTQGAYTINIKFGGESVPQGTFVQQSGPLPDEEIISAEQTTRAHAAPAEPSYPGGYRPVDFCLPVGPEFNKVSAKIKMPSGETIEPKIEDNKDGTVTVRFTPSEVGQHDLTVKYNDTPIQGSPFKFHVDAVDSGYVTAYGPGLSHGMAGEPATFSINTKHAGQGGLAVAVEGPSKAEIKCIDNKDGTCTVNYFPSAAGEYKIIVKFADKHIAGSPFTSKVTGSPRKKASVNVGSKSEVSLKVTETDISNLTATIKSPSGTEQPCMLKKLANGHLGISFTPKETGEHLVNVLRNGKPIPNSPFKIHVGESELGNAAKVKVSGPGLKGGMAHQKNDFTVDTKNAGYGGLSLSIEGPSKADIECKDNEDGSCNVSYRPSEPGTYIVNIKFADKHVPGSPYTVRVGGEPSQRLTEKITRQRTAANFSDIGSQCELSLKIPGTSPFDMQASVLSPGGHTELCDIMNRDDNHYSIKFVPKEIGIHTVSVKHKDVHIPGSPFQFTVGPMTEGGAHKVRAAGHGLEHGEVGIPGEFNIYTREAGAGGLSIAVEGPSKAEINFEDRKDGSCGVGYTCSEPGEYTVSVKFNDEHIPDSPFKVYVSPENKEARKISVLALQDKGLQPGRPAAFTLDMNGANGELKAFVVSPSGAEEEALIQPIDDDKYAVRFIPHENGPYMVHVHFNDHPIQGSPFRIMVGKFMADPGMVHAAGEGLVRGQTGQPAKFVVDTVDAGSGALSVTIDGPSKVALQCKEVEDGYEFSYVPSAPGDYLITIKYGGNFHIVGSPFKAHITGPGKPSKTAESAHMAVETVVKSAEASKLNQFKVADSHPDKVNCKGLGLKKAFINRQAQFTVETKDAGHNMLMVGIMGPGGVPCEEIHVKHGQRQTYNVSYLVKEKGDYLLMIKWGDEHVPGSPYPITVV
ncbi:filamin-C-like isoform X4 [Tubulanus polymorphus]|uniref:filamin-C-like isoform X4 n=1 Tax=Tubulanus polymorphus TaxID=672921 RepID=UPI003DA267D0